MILTFLFLYFLAVYRNATDFDYEANMDYFNKGLAPELETVYLIASHEVTPVSSSRVRELIYFEGDISSCLLYTSRCV